MTTTTTSRFWTRRRGWLTLVVAGVGLSTLLGSGLLAVVADEGWSGQNNIDSGAFAGVHNLELALTGVANSTCSGVAWEDGDLGPSYIASANLSDGRLSSPTVKRICARTFRTGTYTLSFGLNSVIDSETACSNLSDPPESQVDSSCGSAGGGGGELTRVLKVGANVEIVDEGGVRCVGASRAPRAFQSANLATGGTPFQLCEITRPGGIVSFVPTYEIDQAATETNLIAAQTDKVGFFVQVLLNR